MVDLEKAMNICNECPHIEQCDMPYQDCPYWDVKDVPYE